LQRYDRHLDLYERELALAERNLAQGAEYNRVNEEAVRVQARWCTVYEWWNRLLQQGLMWGAAAGALGLIVAGAVLLFRLGG
jgi:hypothetical protein